MWIKRLEIMSGIRHACQMGVDDKLWMLLWISLGCGAEAAVRLAYPPRAQAPQAVAENYS
jgi:hypothetical protein